MENITALLKEYGQKEFELKRKVMEHQFQSQETRVNYQPMVEHLEISLLKQSQKATSLFNKINNMDTTVRQLVVGVTRLNRAKRNLQGMITLTKKLLMLESTLNHLSMAIRLGKFKETVGLLMAAIQFTEFLKPVVSDYPKFYSSIEWFEELKEDLRKVVWNLFQGQVGRQGGFRPKDKLVMADVSMIAELLGSGLVDQLVNWYCEVQLRDYKTMSRENYEVSPIRFIIFYHG